MSSSGPKCETIKESTKQLMELVMQGAKLSRAFPSLEDQEYFLSLYPDLRPLFDSVQQNCISLTNSLLEVNRSQKINMPTLNYKDSEEVRDKYDDIIDITDEKLEFIVCITKGITKVLITYFFLTKGYFL